MYSNMKYYENICNCLRVIQQDINRKLKSANCWQRTSLSSVFQVMDRPTGSTDHIVDWKVIQYLLCYNQGSKRQTTDSDRRGVITSVLLGILPVMKGFYNILSLDVRKPVFGVSDLVRHKPGCTVTEDG